MMKLAEIAEIIGGVNFQPSDICKEGIRVLRGGNIQSKQIVLKDDDVVLPMSYQNAVQQIRIGDTILVASTGSVDVLGKAATCFTEISNTYVGAFLRIIRPKKKKYTMVLSMALTSDYFREYVQSQAKGTSIHNINKTYLENFEIPIPLSFDNISVLYQNIEHKLALNRTINQNLEAMAKQLYDYWFVQFDFPNEEGKPYKSSGGKMVWNEKLKREIPKGWDVKKLSDLMPIITGKQDANFATTNGKYKFFTCSREVLTCDTPFFEGDSILLSGNGDIHTKFYSGKFNAYQRTYVLTPTNSTYFASTYFACTNAVDRLVKGTSGSIVKFITKGMIEEIYIIIEPTGNMHQKLNTILFNILNNNTQIETLTKQRDELLPLLMNGQVSVNSD